MLKYRRFVLPVALSLALIASLSLSPAQANPQQCQALFHRHENAPLPPGIAFNHNPRIFDTVADRILQHRNDFLRILSAVDNYHGAVYEIEQVAKTLRGVKIHELQYLQQIQGVSNIAVYGSTNIPLYTLILHAILPASTGAHVWFRTPQASRQTYVEAMAKIREIMPELNLSHIHLLTESRDVQYDYFRKQHVLGLNSKGTRSVRPPSEVVIFTGSPKTGEELRQTLTTKLNEIAQQTPNVKTIFMQFGSGLNPVIVTELARGVRLEAAVQSSIQSIRINSAQDCIAPKFYALHTNVADQFTSRLTEEIGKLRFGPRDDQTADYSSLTFAENVDKLVAFKERWRQYLVNPNATIDSATKRVDPHVFVFPFEMFTQVELVDHYAPFLVTFKYSSKAQLETIANDPRVKSRAMFASVFGDSASPDMVFLRKLFEDNFHATVLNQSVFVEESGNFPFGGYSAAASNITLFSRSNGAELRTFTYARPLLFSRETRNFFAPETARVAPATIATGRQSPGSTEGLSELLTRATDITRAPRDGTQIWTQLLSPQLQPRPSGLATIRSAIARHGLHRIVEGARPRTATDIEKDRLFYGDTILYTADRPREPLTRVQGVVIHPSWIGSDIQTMNTYRGDINPHMGFGFMHPLLFSSKRAEFVLADAIMPGSMPRSSAYSNIISEAGMREIEMNRTTLLARLDGHIRQRRPLTLAERGELTTLIERHVERFFEVVNRLMPDGAFIKNFNEATTGDLGNQITSFSQNARNYAAEFVERFNSNVVGLQGSFSTPESQTQMGAQFYETGAKMITKLLADPADLLVQQRVKLAKTDLGFPVEIRVDFIDGEAVHSRPRYTHEYLAPEQAEAERVLNNFFTRAPAPVRMLSGGADVAKLEDGRWVFIEFNFGANSGTMHPQLFPIESNLYVSRLRGRATPLITKLEDAFKGGIAAQRSLLSSLRVEEDRWQKAAIDEMSLSEVAKYLRNRHLDEWRKNPTEANAQTTLANINAMVNGLGSPHNRDLPLLILGAQNFITHQLMTRGLSQNGATRN